MNNFIVKYVICIILIRSINTTIDLNAAELQYLADHLTAEECRRLIASAHFKTYQEPNALNQEERKISKDLPCIQLLHHWNSQSGEGKGETHELLEHRLRQMGKYKLADWMGRTVFHELAIDLNRSIEHGLDQLANEASSNESAVPGPTLMVPVIENEDPTEWTMYDSLLYATLTALLLILLALCMKVCCSAFLRWKRNRRQRKPKFHRPNYEILDEPSDSESEERFDVRHYTDTDGDTRSVYYDDKHN